MRKPRTCVGEDGQFIVGIHKPHFEIKNLRDHKHLADLGELVNGTIIDNQINFPKDDLYEPKADMIYEIPNAFPFRGTTYINSAWADAKASHPQSIGIKPPAPCSYLKNIKNMNPSEALDLLPHPLLIALAQNSTDPAELILLAKKSCKILHDPETDSPTGIGYIKKDTDRIIPDILDHELFEVVVNNRFLPDDYKNTLVLKPGVQGNNEITGEYTSTDGSTHVFEYLRRNSYIPWGHFASNMANDAIRYRARDLCEEDMTGIRHLYYQRAYVRVAQQVNIALSSKRQHLSPDELEGLRLNITKVLSKQTNSDLSFDSTLWGWNYGFGYAPSGHRLHASHQMIHQQNAMIPKTVKTSQGNNLPSFACGDLIDAFMTQYKKATGQSFFKNYLNAINNNTRTDGNPDHESSLVVMEDDHTILFVPKAQISEWELQLMPKTACGNILEADQNMRKSIDNGIFTALKILDLMGAQMVTSIEFSKRFDTRESEQHLLYSFIPRLPYAPDTFSEAQLRWISGCYPEDVARACRKIIDQLDGKDRR
ncbi:MAG: hypothetical protein L3J69_19080 [Desulfobacula sp.]|nr:hypothetical protein [Desulfobacula sp.]